MGLIQLPQRKRIRIKLSNTQRLRDARAEHELWKKQMGIDKIQPRKDRGTLEFPPTEDRTGIPLGNKIPVKGGYKTEPQQYSGERKLLGIATMHKSNMVPVFDEQSARDIAKMRR